MDEDNLWYVKLRKCLDEDPSKLQKISERVPRGTLKHYTRGTPSDVSRINSGTRAWLYKITQIEELRPEHYTDPEKLTVEVMLSGNHPKEHLEMWMGYYGISAQQLADFSGVHRHSVRNFLRGSAVSSTNRNKILSALRKYSSRKDKVEMDEIPAGTVISGKGEERINDLTRAVDNLSQQVRMLGGSYELNPEERKTALEETIDALVGHMDYYRTATQEERNRLASHLIETGQTRRIGWLMNIISGIHEVGKTPNTFARDISPPEKLNNRRKK